MLLSKWLLVGASALACVSVWGVLIFTVLTNNNVENGDASYNEKELSTIDLDIHSTTILSNDLKVDQELTEVLGSDIGTNYRVEEIRNRGIRTGDFSKLAPDKIISIDDLLAALEE